MSNAHRLAGIARSVAQDLGRAVLEGVLGRSDRANRSARSTRPSSRTRSAPQTSAPPPGRTPRTDTKRIDAERIGTESSETSKTTETIETIEYAARADGRPDPGEIVWAWVPYEEDASRGKDRPVLVIAVEASDLLVLPTTSKDHDRDAAQEAAAGRHWMDIGAGSWDSRRRPSEVRLDRIVRIEAGTVRREGAALDRVTFERVVTAMRALQGGRR